MRRRAPDFRRPVKRRIPNVVWIFCLIILLIFIVILSKENKIEPRPTFPKVKIFSFHLYLIFYLRFFLRKCREMGRLIILSIGIALCLTVFVLTVIIPVRKYIQFQGLNHYYANVMWHFLCDWCS